MSKINPQTPYTFDRVIRIIISIAFVVGIYFLLDRLSKVLIPFLIAFLIAYLFNPLVEKVQNITKAKKRIFPVLFSFILVSTIIFSLFFFLSPLILKQIKQASFYVNQYLQSKETFLPSWIETEARQFIHDFNIKETLSIQSVEHLGEKIFPKIKTIFSSSYTIIGGLFTVVTIILYLVFILVDYKTIAEGWKDYLPVKIKQPTIELIGDLERGMNVYFRAQATVALFVGILFSIGFSIIGLPLGILLGLFVGALNLVPYLQIVGLIPAILLAFLKSMESDQTFGTILILVLAVFAIVQLIQDAILVPKIMGNVTGLHPAIILLSLSIWGSLLGVIGMLIALPISTLIISYYNRFVIGDIPPPEEEINLTTEQNT